jgi:cellulose synthase/poly-beta-1,6-N-acetylglucosamine synthase-like glycosyltransferase
MAGQLQNLESWLLEASRLAINVCLVHDVRDEATSKELKVLVSRLNLPTIRLFENVFGNQGAARNFGLSNTETKWVAFWDSDDLGAPQTILKALEEDLGGLNLIIGQYRFLSAQKKIKYVSADYRLLDLPKNLGIWRMVFKRELLSEARFPDLQMAEDQVFFARVLSHTPAIKFVDDVFYTYVQGGVGQITRNRNAILQIPLAIKQLQSILFSIGSPIKILVIAQMILRLRVSYFKRTILRA